jgi:hypothetical protein
MMRALLCAMLALTITTAGRKSIQILQTIGCPIAPPQQRQQTISWWAPVRAWLSDYLSQVRDQSYGACIPKAVTEGQLTRVVVQYITARPQRQHECPWGLGSRRCDRHGRASDMRTVPVRRAFSFCRRLASR